MRLGHVLAAVLAMVLASPPLAAQSPVDTAREVYPFLIECSVVSVISAQLGYNSRHSMDEWIEIITPTAGMIGADAKADATKYADDLIARMARDGVETTDGYILDKAKFCDDLLDSAG